MTRRGRPACLLIAAVMALMVLTNGPSGAEDLRDDPSLARATLRLNDLPRDWAIADDTGRDENGGRLPPLCGVAAPVPTARSIRSFAEGSANSVNSVVMRFRAGRAKAYLDALGPVSRRGCPQIIETGVEGDGPYEARFERMSLPRLGDQALGLRLVKAPFASEVILIRRGDVISVVATGAILGPTLPAAPLAKVAATRLTTIG